MKTILHILILLISFVLMPKAANASHWGGGEINYKCLGFSQYEVSLTLYGDCSGTPPYTVMFVNYQSSCGNGALNLMLQGGVTEVTPFCPAMLPSTTCNGGPNPGVSKAYYVDTVTLPGNCTDWQFSLSSCCRNNATFNIQNAASVNLGLMSNLDNLSFMCNSNPRFLNPGIAFAQLSQPFVYDPHAVDDDGDDLRFRLVSAIQAPGMPVFYAFGLSGTQPIFEPFTLDSLTGRISFTPVATPGDFIITYLVDEYRNGILIGQTQREVRITMGSFGLNTNTPPTDSMANVVAAFSVGETIYTCSGQPVSFDLIVNDVDAGDTVNIIHYDVYEVTTGATFSISGQNPTVGTFNWTPQTPGIYHLGFIIQDPKCPIVASHQYLEKTIVVYSSGAILSATDQYLCSSPSITITAYGTFSSYTWSTGDTTQSIVVDSAGVYSITTTGSCGTSVSSIEIFDDPQVQIDGNNSDTIIIAAGDTIQLPATFANGLASDLFFCKDTLHTIPAGGVTTVPILVSNVFPTILDSGSVVDVCLNISQAEAQDLDIYLVAPNGAMITLSTNNGSSGSYANTCFSINASDLINNYNASNIPVDSSFVPQGNWEHFYGGAAASEWQLAIRHDSSNGTAGLLTKFSIQFGGEYDYIWTPNYNMSCSDCSNPFVWPDTVTSYIVEMTNGANCVSFDTIVIIPLGPPNITASDTFLCAASNITLDAGDHYPCYLWSTGETTQTIVVNTSGVYAVTVCGVSGNNADSITIYQAPTLTLSLPTTIAAGDTTLVYALVNGNASLPTGYSFNWTSTGSIDCDTCLLTMVYPNNSTHYLATLDYNNGACIVEDSVLITVVQPVPTNIVYIDVAEDSVIAACANFSPYLSNFQFTNVNVLTFPTHGFLLPFFNYTSSTFCFDFIGASTSELVDTVVIVFCDNIICDTTIFIFTTTSCVWAGDTDTDQQVNNFDLLPIGLGYGQTGFVRQNADLLFDCEPNRNWQVSTPVTNIDYKHSDCDGNGTVNGIDTVAIVQNWGQFYVKSGSSPAPPPLNPIPLYTEYYQTIEGATIQVPIILGDSINPVDSAYGIAFTINYDETLVDSGSVFVGFSPSWMGTANSDMISINKDFYNQGQIQAAVTRIDQTHRNGFGQIGFIQMTIKDDIIKKSANIHLNMHIDNVRLITDQEVEIPTVPVYTYVLILDTTTITHNPVIAGDEAKLNIFPNPASSIVYLQSDHATISQFQVFNATGQEVLNEITNDSRAQFSVAHLVPGMYVVRVQTDKGFFNKRIVIRR